MATGRNMQLARMVGEYLVSAEAITPVTLT